MTRKNHITPIPLPFRPPFYELGGLKITGPEIRAILGAPQHIETDGRRTSGGEEETWAFQLPSGQKIAVVSKVPYNVAAVYSDRLDLEQVFDFLKVPIADKRWILHKVPVAFS